MTKNIEGVEIVEFELDRFVLHLRGGFFFLFGVNALGQISPTQRRNTPSFMNSTQNYIRPR